MADFSELSKTVGDSTLSKVYEIIARSQTGSGLTTDSSSRIRLSHDNIAEIQDLTWQRVYAEQSLAGPVMSLADAKAHVASGISKLTVDSYFNPVNGQGTAFDPGYYNMSSTPVIMTPMEASSYYAQGGIPGMILDTKAGGMLTNGYRFIGTGWKPEWLETLKEYADSLNFDQHAIRDPNRDGLIFGGAMAVPSFKKDRAWTYGLSNEDLIKEGIISKDCIDHIWHADRWNCVLVPDCNIADSDYLTPKHIFVPIAGVNVNTERAAIIRPKQLDYWGTMRQMGWGIPEFTSWIQPLLGYQMGIVSVPIMMQQMSVMYSHLPMDAMMAMGGPAAVSQLAEQVRRQLVEMSNIAPKTFNQALELKVIERNFQGFPEMINVLQDALCAGAELSPAIVFGRQSSGLGNNDGESTLKQAASIQKIANRLIPQLQPLVKVLVYSCFGPDSVQAKLADKVRVDFDSPVVLTNKERNEAGTTFSTVVTAMIGAGLQPGDALEVGKSFIPDIELPQDVLDKLAQIADMGLNDETTPGDGVQNLFDRLHPEADGIGNLGERLRDETGVSNLHDRLTGSGDGEAVKTLGQRIKGMFSRGDRNA